MDWLSQGIPLSCRNAQIQTERCLFVPRVEARLLLQMRLLLGLVVEVPAGQAGASQGGCVRADVCVHRLVGLELKFDSSFRESCCRLHACMPAGLTAYGVRSRST